MAKLFHSKCLLILFFDRICAKPPPLLAQAQAVQWRQPGHDHGGASGDNDNSYDNNNNDNASGRCGDQQQQHSVSEKVFSVSQKFFLCKSNIRTPV